MNESICSLGVKIKDVLVAINHKPFGVAFIVDENKKLCGVLSDGDIRRLLISGVEINTILSKELLNSEFVYGEEQESVKSLLSKTNEKIRVIPIVNSAFEPVDYFKPQL